MKYLKKYKYFIEKYTIDQNDDPGFAADKTSFNKMENDIKEFLAKKVTIDNIYLTYSDEKDLVNKLFAQKFIEQNTGDKKKIKFINPLIRMYSQTAEKKRELKSAEGELLTQNDTLTQRQSDINQNPDNKDSLQNDVDYTQSKIGDIKDKINTLKNEILSLEKTTSEELKKMKKDLENNKKRIDYFMKND